jgi:transcriptional regulator with XRE-family HTH domain
MNNDNTADIRTTIADRIRELRRLNGMSQEQLAEASGVSRRTIQALEAGTTSPRLDLLEKLAEAMDHTVNLIKKTNNE